MSLAITSIPATSSPANLRSQGRLLRSNRGDQIRHVDCRAACQIRTSRRTSTVAPASATDSGVKP
ncbi:MAG: hypothetical protein IPP47_09875 [Bryobacterales bacterium]|nr:hypothetical protein [Bryobacterales bacterium]